MAYPDIPAVKDCVIGEWKSFTFHIATLEDGPAIVQHLGEHFIPTELVNLHIGGGEWNADRAADTLARIQPALENRLSLYVTLHGSKEIIAVNLVTDSRQASSFVGVQHLAQARSPITRRLCVMWTIMARGAEPIFQAKFKCDFHAEIWIISVRPDYAGRGIATEMCERTLKLLKLRGYPVVKSDFTHPGTQRVGQKFGFEEVRKCYLKDVVAENGTKTFPNARDDEFMLNAAKRL